MLDAIATSTGYDDLQCVILPEFRLSHEQCCSELNVFDVSVQILAALYNVTQIAGPRVVLHG
jgi:hypothetical protein